MANLFRLRHLLQHHVRRYVSNAFVGPLHSSAADSVGNAERVYRGSVASTSLQGQLIAVKDNICTTDFPTTCASNILGQFRSPYDATVVELLRRAGAVIVGKTNMDEFGMGSHSTHSRFGPVVNSRGGQSGMGFSPGGSSGGSAVAVRDEQAHAALGTDTGGSVRLPAAYTGVMGFKPSYGLLSRYGVVAYANSLDTVGIFGRTPAVLRSVFDLLNCYDTRDPSSLSPATRARIDDYAQNRIQAHLQSSAPQEEKAPRYYRIGVPKEYNIEELDPVVRKSWVKSLHTLQSFGHTIYSVSLPATKRALSAYYVLAPAEACSNLAKYDGVRYGQRASTLDDDGGYLYANTRGKGFGDEVKRRILLGTYSLSAAAMDNYFIQAQKVRRLVQQDFDTVFRHANPLRPQSQTETRATGVDFIITPTAPTPPPTLASLREMDPLDAYTSDVFTVPASLAGLPAVSVPISPKDADDRSVGIQVIGQYGSDSAVLDFAEEFHNTTE